MATQLEYVELNVDSLWPNGQGSPEISRNNWPIFNVPQDLGKVKALRVVEATIPNTFYNYMSPTELSRFTFFPAINAGLVFMWRSGIPPFLPTYQETLPIYSGRYTPQSMCEHVNKLIGEGYLKGWLAQIPSLTPGSTPKIELEFNPAQTFQFRITCELTPPSSDLISEFLDAFIYLEDYTYTKTQIGRFWGVNPSDTPITGSTPSYAIQRAFPVYVSGNERQTVLQFPLPSKINFPPYLMLGSNIIGSYVKSFSNSAEYQDITANSLIQEYQGYDKYITGDPYSPFGQAFGGNSYQLTTIPLNLTDDTDIVWTNPEERFFEIPNLNLTKVDFFFTYGRTTEIVDFRASGFHLKLGLLVEKRIFT